MKTNEISFGENDWRYILARTLAWHSTTPEWVKVRLKEAKEIYRATFSVLENKLNRNGEAGPTTSLQTTSINLRRT